MSDQLYQIWYIHTLTVQTFWYQKKLHRDKIKNIAKCSNANTFLCEHRDQTCKYKLKWQYFWRYSLSLSWVCLWHVILHLERNAVDHLCFVFIFLLATVVLYHLINSSAWHTKTRDASQDEYDGIDPTWVWLLLQSGEVILEIEHFGYWTEQEQKPQRWYHIVPNLSSN